MPEHAHRLVAILYDHPLLGEGIARLLADATDVEVALAAAACESEMDDLLSRRPDVVVFEGEDVGAECLRLVPEAVLVDVSSAMSTSSQKATTTAELLSVVRAGA